eukprot:TRINITY_DN5606_c0_g1_i1.p1 TRINITY_DN5606_c0_g1~~TRINITY_DN5606_c0_g1_i1.p1  ORF type:complete len:335 (+),score=74.20 TRINITY_DN5606_c0_g1_i1:73-1005(+)
MAAAAAGVGSAASLVSAGTGQPWRQGPVQQPSLGSLSQSDSPPQHAARLRHKHLPLANPNRVNGAIVRLQVDPRTSLEVPADHLRLTARAAEHLQTKGHVGWCRRHHSTGVCSFGEGCSFAHVVDHFYEHYCRVAEQASAQNAPPMQAFGQRHQAPQHRGPPPQIWADVGKAGWPAQGMPVSPPSPPSPPPPTGRLPAHDDVPSPPAQVPGPCEAYHPFQDNPQAAHSEASLHAELSMLRMQMQQMSLGQQPQHLLLQQQQLQQQQPAVPWVASHDVVGELLRAMQGHAAAAAAGGQSLSTYSGADEEGW